MKIRFNYNKYPDSDVDTILSYFANMLLAIDCMIVIPVVIAAVAIIANDGLTSESIQMMLAAATCIGYIILYLAITKSTRKNAEPKVTKPRNMEQAVQQQIALEVGMPSDFHREYFVKLRRYRTCLICLSLLFVILFIVAAVWISRLNTSLDDAQNSYFRLANKNITLTKQVETYKDATESFREKYSAIEDEYNFYHRHAVIVTSRAGKKYHKYGCPYIEDKSFYIFNIEAAKAKGYVHCSYCYG